MPCGHVRKYLRDDELEVGSVEPMRTRQENLFFQSTIPLQEAALSTEARRLTSLAGADKMKSRSLITWTSLKTSGREQAQHEKVQKALVSKNR